MHFASYEMLREEVERCCHEVRFETRRCIRMRLRPRGHAAGAYSAPPDLLAGFVTGIEKEEWNGLGREMERKEKDRRNWNLGVI